MLNYEDLAALRERMFKECTAIMEAKNADYTAGGGPFANFMAGEVLGVEAEIGILLRCLDKFQRIRSFVLKGELKVKEESVDDAIKDVINYMVLLSGVIENRKAEG